MHVRLALPVAVCAALLATTAPAQALDIAADEMSSPAWRDCAGHFFFLAAMLRESQGGEALVEQMNGMGLMAVYASEERAEAERKAGRTGNGLGESLADAASGELQVPMRRMIEAHAEKSRAYADNTAYVNAYAAKCGGPTRAFADRFGNALKGK